MIHFLRAIAEKRFLTPPRSGGIIALQAADFHRRFCDTFCAFGRHRPTSAIALCKQPGQDCRPRKLTEGPMIKWMLIGFGGAIGSMLRHAAQTAVQRVTGAAFPLGTLAVNLTGCLIIGLLAAAAVAAPAGLREEHRLGLMVGLVGGFTTFSAFGLETLNLADAGQFRLALANVVLSCALGLLAVWLGVRLGQRYFGDWALK
jgi:fluoride exporter